jgi:hypothetical protein
LDVRRLDTIKADAEGTGGGFTVVEFLDFEGSSVPVHVNDRARTRKRDEEPGPP